MKVTVRCPRCGGNLFVNRENSVPELTCLQCSRAFRVVTPVARPAAPALPRAA